MTAVNANIAAPRLLQVGGGAVRQIAEVLASSACPVRWW